MQKSNTISRYAPTPSGHLHLGNILNFLITANLTKERKGVTLLRIDDADMHRVRDEYINEIFEILKWLELPYHIGPLNLADHKQHWCQQNKFNHYFSYVQKGLADGTLFACNCSRTEIDHCHCINRGLTLLRGKNLVRAKIDGSPVIWRRDDIPAYHLTTIVDDHDYNINLVVRGEDLRESTEIQRELCTLLNLPTFLKAEVIHHPLILDEFGKKLSKSKGSTSISHMKSEGITKDALLKKLSNYY